MTPDLSITGIAKSFDGVTALAGVTFTVTTGTVTGLIGPNGSGKTTLFNVISGFLAPDAGEVRWQGRPLTGLPPHRVARRGIARTFQTLRLIWQLSALDNVLLAFPGQRGEGLMGALLDPRVGPQGRKDRDQALGILDEIGLGREARSRAEELSYGQQKLLSLAMCLATGASLLLLDEPVAGIAPMTAEAILDIVNRLKAAGKTILLIEHNLEAISAVADHLIVLASGHKIAEGSVHDVLRAPEVLESYLGRPLHA